MIRSTRRRIIRSRFTRRCLSSVTPTPPIITPSRFQTSPLQSRPAKKIKTPVCFLCGKQTGALLRVSIGSSCYPSRCFHPSAPGGSIGRQPPMQTKTAILLTWTMDGFRVRAHFLPSHGNSHNGCLSATHTAQTRCLTHSGRLLWKLARPHSSGRVGALFFHRGLSKPDNPRLQIFG